MEAAEGRLAKQMKRIETELSMMATENEILKERCEEYEKRLKILEGPKFRHM